MSLSLSVIVPAHRTDPSLRACVDSVLRNPRTDLEVIVVMGDAENGLVPWPKGPEDPRLVVIRADPGNGAGAARNQGAGIARGGVFFFLDSDCVAAPDWLEEGLRAFDQPEIVGVEGAIFYPKLSPSLREKVPVNPFYNLGRVSPINEPGRDFAAASIAYRAEAFRLLGGFNTTDFRLGREDTDLGLRASRLGKIAHQPRMRVTHRSGRWTFRELQRNSRRYAADVALFQIHGNFPFRFRRVLHPRLLFAALFPPTLFFWLRPRCGRDFIFLGPLYFYAVSSRWHIWRAAWERRIFLL